MSTLLINQTLFDKNHRLVLNHVVKKDKTDIDVSLYRSLKYAFFTFPRKVVTHLYSTLKECWIHSAKLLCGQFRHVRRPATGKGVDLKHTGPASTYTVCVTDEEKGTEYESKGGEDGDVEVGGAVVSKTSYQSPLYGL